MQQVIDGSSMQQGIDGRSMQQVIDGRRMQQGNDGRRMQQGGRAAGCVCDEGGRFVSQSVRLHASDERALRVRHSSVGY
jgi:hypothetical protein